MPSFEFFSVPRIVFGIGQFKRLPELAAPLGASALVIYSLPEPALEAIAARLNAAKIRTTPFRQKGEPTVNHLDSALHVARSEHCDCIIAIGGGSAIDCAKATAGMLTNGGTALDYMEVVGKGQKLTQPAAPWIAVPTTAGTGAEATRNAVIGYPEKNFKASIRSELLLPRIALIDPELAVHVPAHVTASSGMDALCQCIEAYTSSGATPMTDPLALEGLTRAARSLRRAFQSPDDLTARQDMALAALLSGIALTNAGLGAVHGFAAPLGASFPIPHGTICAALLPHVIAANVTALRTANNASALSRYATIARAAVPTQLVPTQVVPTPSSAANNQDAIDALITFTHSLAQALHIPRLATFGLTPAAIPSIVTLAQKSSSMRYNPIPLSRDLLEQILSAAL